jgi:phosphatidylglycerophosphatase A
MLIATGLGLGFLPIAPGTWGSLGALAVLGPLRFACPPAFAVLLAALCAAGIVAAGRAARALADPDPRRVVIDEVVGMGLTLAAVRVPAPASLLALERLPGGFGIVADDAGAAGYAALVLWLIGRV